MYCKVIQNKLLCKFERRKKMWIIYELYNFDTTFSIKKEKRCVFIECCCDCLLNNLIELCMVREMQKRCDTAHILIRMCFRHNTICVLREKSIEILAKALYFLFDFLVPYFHRHLFYWLLHMFFFKNSFCLKIALRIHELWRKSMCVFFYIKWYLHALTMADSFFLEIWSCFLHGIHLRRQKWKWIMRKIQKK